jgi:hypothetical protein
VREGPEFSQMIRKLLIFAALPLLAADPPAPTRVSSTQTIPFTGTGTLRFERSSGDIDIQGWDRPEIELVFTRSTYNPKVRPLLDGMHIKADRHGNDVIVSTVVPKHKDVQLNCQIHAPRNVVLAIDRNKGEVNVAGITGDIQARVRDGQITLRLPENGVYSIAAKSRTGKVFSDFGGAEKYTWLFGDNFAKPENASKKLDLQIGFGDILILKTPYHPPASL